MRKAHILLILLLCFCSSAALYAAEDPGAQIAKEVVESGKEQNTAGFQDPSVLTKMAVLAGLALLPFAIMLLTSYLKMVIVLALLRNALGVQQSPPNQAINGIAMLMTVYVMAPTLLAMYNSSSNLMQNAPRSEVFSPGTAGYIVEVVSKAKEPLKEFLERNVHAKHTGYFYQLAQRNFPEPFKSEVKRNDFIILVPSYITSQVKGAFEIGVLIYLPFFVVDLVTSNILLAMGMMMLSPLSIALPLKLLLLVMVDGWTMITYGLVLTYR